MYTPEKKPALKVYRLPYCTSKISLGAKSEEKERGTGETNSNIETTGGGGGRGVGRGGGGLYLYKRHVVRNSWQPVNYFVITLAARRLIWT